MQLTQLMRELGGLQVAKLVVIFCQVFFASSNIANAQIAQPQLVYAGFAFEGDADNRNFRYPHVADLHQKQPDLIRTQFLNKLNNPANASVKQKLSLNEANEKHDPIMVAFALTQETYEKQVINGQHWAIVVLQANVLAFNNSSSSVVGSYPVRLRLVRTFAQDPTQDDIKRIVREAFTSTNQNENIIDLWLNKLATVSFRNAAIKRIRVINVNLAKEAKDYLTKSKVNESTLKSSVASDIEISLSSKAGIPLLPNTVGEAIGNSIALRFSDKSIQIKIPDADYEIYFAIRGFASATTDSNNQLTDIFRVKSNLTIKIGGEDNSLFNEDMYETKFLTRPKSVSLQLDEWTQYRKTLQEFILALGTQLQNPQDEWLIEHASKGSDAKQSFNKAKTLIQELK